jgi:hypothetical protein
MATPVLGRDYKIYGFNADGDGKILTRSGSMGLYVKPTTNSLLLTGRANINVGEIVTSAASGGNVRTERLIDITENGYNL